MLVEAGADLGVGVDYDMSPLPSRAVMPGTVFCNASGEALPFETSSFDVIVSFETIEHVPDDNTFLSEIKRVLKPGGTLFLSTPNASRSDTEGGPTNPFHFREYQPAELKDVLARYFTSTELMGQVVDPRYGRCPLWDPILEQLSASRYIERRAWQVLHMAPIPFGMKEWISRRIWNRSFYPEEDDFLFLKEEVDKAHVMLAVCSNHSSGSAGTEMS
jgi:ubiquinone/menaquinone biosynthesis C-methylase UbiE